MIRKLLIFMTAIMMLGTVQPICAQDEQKAQIEMEQQTVTITVSESCVHIKNAEKMVLEIYNLAGVKVSTQRIDSADKKIELENLPKGCYIIKVGKTARKICLK